MRHVILLILMVFLGSSVYAAPVITGTSGTYTHGNSITIAGSGFGTKTTAAPSLWDNCSGTDPRTLWTDSVPNTWDQTGISSTYQLTYRTPAQVATQRGYGVALPHSHTTKYMAGAHYSPSTAGGYADVMAWKNRTISAYPAYSYISWYRQYDPNWSFTPSEQGTNHKYFVVGPGQGEPFGNDTWYLQYIAGQFSSNSATVYTNIGDDSSGPNMDWQDTATCTSTNCYVPCDDAGKCAGPWGATPTWIQSNASGAKQTAINGASGVWIKEEVQIRYAQDSTGFIRMYENGVQVLNYEGRTVRTSLNAPLTVSEGIEGYSDVYAASLPNNWRYMADMYMDTTLQHVLLCPGSTYVNRGVCEVQIPTAWASGSITATLNQGALADNSTAYAYVMDNTGAYNASGYSVTLGTSGGGDITAPTITAFIMPPTYTSTTVPVTTFTATDAVGVTGYCITTVNSSAGCSWSGSAPTSATGSNGANTFYAWARDAAGNVSTASTASTTITVVGGIISVNSSGSFSLH